MEELVRRFGDEAACELHMIALRWPGGFECPRCRGRSYARVAGRREFRRVGCGWQFSATSGTLVAHTKVPLTKWFRAAFMVCSDARGASAQAVARECGVSDLTGASMLRRLRAAMGFAMRLCRVGGEWVEADGATIACGRTGPDGPRRVNNGVGRAPVAVAVSGARLCVRAVSDQTAGSLDDFFRGHVSRLGPVRCDGLPSAQRLAGGWDPVRRRFAAGGDHEGSLPAVHHVISNLKAKLAGTCHGVTCARLQEHCDELSWKYCHRRGDQMADLLLELARWPHVRLADIRSVAERQPGHRPSGRDPGYGNDRRVAARALRGIRQDLATDVASVAALKAAGLTHL